MGQAGARTGAGAILRALARSCHPEPVVAVTAIAGVLALAAGRGPAGTAWTVLAILSGQLAVGWTNDYLDRDLDRREGRVDKPVAEGEIKAATVRRAAILALLACVPLSLVSGPASAAAHLLAVGSAMAYNAGLKVRPLSALPYAVSFGLLPSVITLGLPGHRPAAVWASIAGALLGLGGHFTQVLPDIPADRALGIRGLPQLMGEKASGLVAAALLAIAATVITFGPGRPPALGLAGLGLALALSLAVLATALAGRVRLSFRLTLATTAVAGVAFLAGGRSL